MSVATSAIASALARAHLLVPQIDLVITAPEGAALVLMSTCRYDLPDVRAAAERFLAKINLRTGNFVHLLEVAKRFDVAPAIESCVQYAEAPDNFHRLFACVRPHACMAYCLHVLLAAAMLECTVAQMHDVCAAASSDTVHLLRNPPTCKHGLLLVFSFVSFELCRLKGDQWLKVLPESTQLRIAFPALRKAYSDLPSKSNDLE